MAEQRYPLRSRKSLPGGTLGEEEERTTGTPQDSANVQRTNPLVILDTSAASASSASRKSSNPSTVRSFKIRQDEVDQQAEKELLELEEQEEELNRSVTLNEMELKQLKDKLINRKQRLDDNPPEDQAEYRTRKNELLLLEERIEDKMSVIERQQIEVKSYLKLFEKKRQMILKVKKLETDKIAEDNDQYISDDDSSILTKLETSFGGSMLSPESIDAQAKEKQRELQKERLVLENRLAQQKVRAEETLLKAKLEADKAEELNRQAAEAAQAQIDIEELIMKHDNPKSSSNPNMSNPMASTPTTTSVADQLALVLAQALGKVNLSGEPTYENKYLARKSHGKDLPYFNGRPEEWPQFISDYERTTKACGFTDTENMSRLRKCLKGEAAKAVQCLMISPDNVPEVLSTLKTRFGQAEHVIKAMIAKAKQVPAVKEDKMETLIEFGTAVINMTSTIKALGGLHHLSNPNLLDELESRLPVAYRVQWRDWIALQHGKDKDLSNFTDWLKNRTEVFCALCPPKIDTEKDEKRSGDHKKRNRKAGEHAMVVDEENLIKPEAAKPIPAAKEKTCAYCSKTGHKLQQCHGFKAATPEARNTYAREKRLCYGCLNYGHSTKDCRSKKVCSKDDCSRYHHTLLHNPSRQEPKNKDEANCVNLIQDNDDKDSEESLDICNYSSQPENPTTQHVGIWILPIRAEGPNGISKEYVALDPCATVSLIHTSLVDKLGIKGQKKDLQLIGINQTTSMPSELINMKIYTADGKRWFPLKNLRKTERLPLPRQTINPKLLNKWKHLKGLNIATYQDGVPMILLGQDHANLVTPYERRRGPANAPMAVKTPLGWTLGGRADDTPSDGNMVLFSHEDEILYRELHHLVKANFTTEDLGVKLMKDKPRSKEDKQAQAILDDTLKEVNGQMETGLLWRLDDTPKPDGYNNAFNRLKTMEKKMDKDPEFARQYELKIQEYLDKGFAKVLTHEEATNEEGRIYYIPHFMVYNVKKPNKSRFVFDCAAEVDGVSLNHRLLKGPDKLRPLPAILNRFRQKKIALTGDIQDMFHRVKVRKEDRGAQRFLWRGMNRDKPPNILQMEVLIFGASCSPVCAIEAMNKSAEKYKDKYPDAVKAIQLCTYMDDYGNSSDTIQESIQQRQEVQEIHRGGSFLIHKWGSNSQEVMASIPETMRAIGLKNMETDAEMDVERILGLFWKPDEDFFTFRLNFLKVEKEILSGERVPTKKELLSLGMSIYDPLGFLSCFTIKCRILMQDTWRWETGWNDELPKETHERWYKWLDELKTIPTFKLPRCYSPDLSTADDVQLHIFGDASGQAFGAVAYFRVVKDMKIDVCLITAKARVTPLKCQSIPRCELQAALIASRLSKYIQSEHDIKIHRTVYWTDSKTVFYWIKADGKRFHTFVSHRIGEIQELTEAADWNWVPGKLNVADELTRDNKLCDWRPSSRWIHGPEFLYLNEDQWPKEKPRQSEFENDQLEMKREYAFMLQENVPPLIDKHKYSSWNKIVRIRAYVQRVLEYCRNKRISKQKVSHQLFPIEFEAAEKWWWKIAQRESFPMELECLEKTEELEKSSRLIQLKPFLDLEGIMRVNGRLSEAEGVPYEVKYPVILDPKNRYTQLLLAHYHKQGGHHGKERIVNEVRQKFYIISVRRAVKSAASNCQICKNERARPLAPEMGKLPAYRLESFGAPFNNTGLDYFGPIQVTVGRRHEKRYGALFTCLSTRAVHLEIAHSMSTDSCIMAIRRFIARRGCPLNLYSDNGTNFVGANHELKQCIIELNQDMLIEECTIRGIKWNFIPPAAPHMGGSWERLVRSVKVALHATLKEAYPKDEVLRTLMTEAEHVVNSHPLTHVSVDHNDQEALTPNHFLLGRSSNVQPFILPCESSRKMWENAQWLADHFWKRWIKEYLPTLLRRTKWNKPTKPIEVGDVVVIVDHNMTRGSWPKGIVTKVYEKDGQVRVVQVKTATNTYERPAIKVAVLDVRRDPVNAEISEEPKNVMTVTTCATRMNTNHVSEQIEKKMPSRLELPLLLANRIGLWTIRQEVAALKKSGWSQKKMNDYREEFKTKRKKATAEIE